VPKIVLGHPVIPTGKRTLTVLKNELCITRVRLLPKDKVSEAKDKNQFETHRVTTAELLLQSEIRQLATHPSTTFCGQWADRQAATHRS
jgi:hypothetical protein